jgi:hypothetical protein
MIIIMMTITGIFFRMLQPHNYDAHVHILPFGYEGKVVWARQGNLTFLRGFSAGPRILTIQQYKELITGSLKQF